MREVKSGGYTPEENNQLVLGIRKYYKEIGEDHVDKWKMLAHHMGGTRTNESIRKHLTNTMKGRSDTLNIINARKKEVDKETLAQRTKYLADKMAQLEQAQQHHQAQVAARQQALIEEIASTGGSAVGCTANSLAGSNSMGI